VRLIAIDPGTVTGHAVFHGGTLTHAGLGLVDMRADEVVIELPEYRRESRVSPNDLIALAVKVGRAMCFYESASGAIVTLVKPSKWKGGVPKTVHHPRILAALADHELDVISKVKCAASALHNVVDAVGLGLWALKRMGRGS
jgi:hypothetical protein